MKAPFLVGAISFLCAVTPATAEVPFLCVPGSQPPADVDVRGDIALADWRVLLECFDGPDLPPDPSGLISLADCLHWFNSDQDRDVDLADVAKFLNRFTGNCQGIGACPEGMELVHRSGLPGPMDPDTFDPELAFADEYRCEPEIPNLCARLDCGPFGECDDSIGTGRAACLCRPGYAGAHCEECAVGYERSPASGVCQLGGECRAHVCSGNGECHENAFGDILCRCDRGYKGEFCEYGTGKTPTLRPPPRIIVRGTDESVEHGTVRRLCAQPLGGEDVDTLITWALDGPGSLMVDRDGFCADYLAPTHGRTDENELARIEICSLNFRDHCAERFLTVTPPGGIAISGQSHPILKPFDDVMIQFMRHRCVGAAILGVNVFGKNVYVRGYGNLSGAPTNNATYLQACDDTFNVTNEVPGIELPPPSPVKWNTPMRIGSNSKCVGAAVLRREIKKHLGPGTTDAEVEALALCSDPALLPADFRNIMCGNTPPPVPLNSSSGLNPNCTGTNPCPLGGTCLPANSTAGTCMNCPAGLSGPDCTVNAAFCSNLSNAADSRWPQVTLGHLLGHRSGMPRSVPSLNTFTIPNLFRFRDLTSLGDWEDQEDLLISTSGYPAGSFLAEFPNFPLADLLIGFNGFFVPRPSAFEAIIPRLGACLVYTPGTQPPAGFDNYSNTAFTLLGEITENVSGRSVSGKEGRPGLHAGGLLEEFLTEELGFPLPGQATEGIYFSQSVFRRRNTKEPVYRFWSTSEDTYYARARDTKRPHCIWNLIGCSFTDWINETVHFNWDFGTSRVLRPYSGGSNESSGVVGILATEAAAYLRFMARFWVGGQGTNPRYGETRCPDGKCDWTTGSSHNGSIDGAYSWALQLGAAPLLRDASNNAIACSSDADCGSYVACQGQDGAVTASGYCRGGLCRRKSEYVLPQYSLCPSIVAGDYDEPVCRACRLPAGVDLFVAINQRNDKRCTLGTPACDVAYGYLKDHLLHAACQVSWPPNPYVIWPPVGLTDGSSGMGLQLSGLPQPGTVGGLSCCGNGVREGSEQCDGSDFGPSNCASYGFTMGSLICTSACTIQTTLCSGGISILPPASYAECGLTDCTDPSQCHTFGDAGHCPGGPCLRTEPGDDTGKLTWFSSFHPDGNYKDQHGNLYYCVDDTNAGQMACIDENGWGVCRRCTGQGSNTTRIGCSCNNDDACFGVEPGLGCYGEDYGGGPGFCWSIQNGPPFWQCAEGACGMAPYYGNDEMYCEHYNGQHKAANARCMPWLACDGPEAYECAQQDLICAQTQASCGGNFVCCANECLHDSHCGQAFGWPQGFGCSPALKCVYEP